tara:strand:+ start:289 stop:1467 length:1179 start_codon:yes stop_codon:yes gene_type:complete
MLIGYAFCLPISIAGISFFESLILILWLVEGRWKDKINAYKDNKVIISLSAFFLFNFISLFWAQDILNGLSYIWKYRHFLIIFVIYTSLDREYLNRIISSFLISMFLTEIMSYGIFFELWQYKDILPSNPSPFMDHISYSFYLAITASIVLSRILIKGDFKVKFIYLLFFITVTMNLFINGGRTGQIVFIVAVCILFLFHLKNKYKAILYSSLLIVGVLSSSYIFSSNFTNRANQLSSELVHMTDNNNFKGSFSTRVSLWVIGGAKFLDNKYIGTGIGNEMDGIEKYTKAYGFDYKYLSTFTDYHNIFITYAVQLGIVGLILVILIFYYSMFNGILNTRYRSLSVVFIVSYLLWSFTGMTFHNVNPMTLFALFVGLFNGIHYLEKINKEVLV